MIASPVTVLHVDSARDRRGGRSRAQRIVTGLAQSPDVRQALLARAGSACAVEAAELGVEVRATPWQADADPRALASLGAGFGEDWDVVHAHDGRALQAVLLARALAGGRAPVVATRHADVRPVRPSVWQRADLVIAVSDRVSDRMIAQGIDRRRIEIVWDGAPDGDDPDGRGMLERVLACYRALARGRR